MSDELRFEGRVAIVTGAGHGLGRAHARLLAQRGAKVVVNDVSGGPGQGEQIPDRAGRVVDEIEALGGVAVACTASVATPEGGEAIVETALDAFGRLDILVNNAGILRDAAFEDTSEQMLAPVLDVHLKGAFNVTRPAWAHMCRQSYGRIVNTTSSSGLFGTPRQTNYAAAKMGLVGLTRVLAIEAHGYGIQVNAIAPTGWTGMTDAVFPASYEHKLRPELVSPVVAWLAHEECSSNGEIYAAGGGSVTRVFLGVTPGIFSEDLTPETVRQQFETVRESRGFREPASSSDEFFRLLDQVGLDNPFQVSTE
jgi:NAD(P)-dependent dehydrogenase (short-subunit alcohol dehydrogenase family)